LGKEKFKIDICSFSSPPCKLAGRGGLQHELEDGVGIKNSLGNDFD
jgi:hypothetical protein